MMAERWQSTEETQSETQVTDDDDGQTVEWVVPEGAQIVVVDTGDGRQKLQLVMEDTGEIMELPPELECKLRENLPDLSSEEPEDVEQLLVANDFQRSQQEVETTIASSDEHEPYVIFTDVDGQQQLLVAEGDKTGPVFLSEDDSGCNVLVASVEGDQPVIITPGQLQREVKKEPEAAADLAVFSGYGHGEVVPEQQTGSASSELETDLAAPESTDGEEGEVEEAGAHQAPPDLDQVPEESPHEAGVEEDEKSRTGIHVKKEAHTSGDEGTSDAVAQLEAESAWTESRVISSTGAAFTLRMPAIAPASMSSSSLEPSARFRVVAARTQPPAAHTETEPAEAPPVAKRKRSRSPLGEIWVRRFATTHRTSSRGIARAVAALKRADSDEDFSPSSSDEEQEEKDRRPVKRQRCTPQPPRFLAAGTRTRGRGRPRKKPGYACTQCETVFLSEQLFSAHLGGTSVVGGAHVSVTVRPDGTLKDEVAHESEHEMPAIAELNVDIIAGGVQVRQCDECDLCFDTERQLLSHSKVHVRQKLMQTAREAAADPLACSNASIDAAEQDGDELMRRAAISAYQQTLDQPDAKYEPRNLKECEFDGCVKMFTTASARDAHYRRMHADRTEMLEGASRREQLRLESAEFECPQCHVTYTSAKVYGRHLEIHEHQQRGEMPFQCGACQQTFLTSQSLRQHLLRHHPHLHPGAKEVANGERKRAGRPAGSSDKNRQMVYDMIEHAESGQYICSLCGLQGKTKSILFYHISVKHNALEGYRCETCERAFFNESQLRAHQRTHTGERPFQCQFCTQRFRKLGDLSTHITDVHNTARPHRCKYCGKGFARKYSLTVHTRCHTNERCYVCHVCHKGFRASTYLKTHVKIHTGERQHQCPICFKSFRLRFDLKRHIFTHSRERRPASRPARPLTTSSGACAGRRGRRITAAARQDLIVLGEEQLHSIQEETDETGRQMVYTGGDMEMPVIDEHTGQLMVAEENCEQYDESRLASMYLMAENNMKTLRDVEQDRTDQQHQHRPTEIV